MTKHSEHRDGVQYNAVFHLRLRMFLCSSSSVVGLWLRRLKREIYNVTLSFLFFSFTHFLSVSQSTRLSASSGKTKEVNFSTDYLSCTATNTHNYTKMMNNLCQIRHENSHLASLLQNAVCVWVCASLDVCT